MAFKDNFPEVRDSEGETHDSSDGSQDDNGNKFYCPGCGRRYRYLKECTGSGEAPHPAIEVTDIREILNAPDSKTDPDGYAKWQQGHTAAPETSA